MICRFSDSVGDFMGFSCFFGYLGKFYGIYGPCWVAIGPALQVLLSNVAAIEQNTRYVEEDLNR